MSLTMRRRHSASTYRCSRPPWRATTRETAGGKAGSTPRPAPVFHSPGAVRNTRLSRRWKISSRSRPEEINAPRSARILALTITAAAPGKFLNHIERHWNEENSNDGRREHAAHYRRPEDLPGLSARATSDRQRDHTQDERERRHQNRPQSYPRGGQRR